MIEIEYLNVVNSVLASISLEDLERELLKLERYDLLINLRDDI